MEKTHCPNTYRWGESGHYGLVTLKRYYCNKPIGHTGRCGQAAARAGPEGETDDEGREGDR